MKKNARMLISLPDGFHLYGFLNTGLAQLLIEECPCIFLIPPNSQACIPAQLRQRARWLCFPHFRLPFAGRMINYVRMEATRCICPSPSHQYIRRRMAGLFRYRLFRQALNPCAWLLARCPSLDRALFQLERWVAPSPLNQILRGQKFSTVIFASAGVKILEAAVMQTVRYHPVKRYGILYSWDNITTKFNYFNRFERLAVWNNILAREAMKYLGYRREQIAVVGIPQFDIYHGFKPQRPRGDALTSWGLPAQARYVLYSSSPPVICPWGPQYIPLILEALPDCYVFIRTHPQDTPEVYREVGRHPRVVVFRSGHGYDAQQRHLGFWLPDSNANYLLAEQLYHADMVVNVASTISLEALFLNRPVVNIAFDMPKGEFPISMLDYYQMEHYSHVVASQAIPVATSPEQLQEYLRTKDRWWPQRAANVAHLNHCMDPFRDSRATERLGRDILAFHQGHCANSAIKYQPGMATIT